MRKSWPTIAVIVVAILAIRLIVMSNQAQVPAAVVLVLCVVYLVAFVVRQRRL